ncbi:MFS transporter [Vibrio metschnikovii]|uniref:MFS transporter n=1 Tax=Vibrio metschnikovii TaxID=28172 RepID=UPI00332350FD
MENITLHKFPKLVDLKLLSMSAGLWGLANGIVYFSLPLYILHNNGSLQDVGIVLSLQWVPVLLLQPFTKEIIQTFGNKLVIVNGCLIRAVSVVCLIYSLSLSNDLAVYFICSILTLLTRLTDVALDTLVIENTTVDDRPIIESYIQSSETFGLVVAPAIGGVAITYFSFVHMFILAFFLFLFSSLMSLYIFRKTFIIQTRKTLKNRPNPHKIYMWFIIDLIEITRNNATVRYFGLLNLSINIFAGLLAALHPYIMSTYYKLDAAFYGIVNSSAAILGFIALAIGGKVITSMGYKRVFHYSWMLLSISILLMIMA